jgi:glycosyltransferase involved in cell wall biosynthesis
MRRLSLLAIGTTYRIAAARQKLISLSNYFDVTCVTSELGKQEIFGRPIREFETSHDEARLRLVRVPEWPRGCGFTKIFFRGLARVVRSARFDIVLVDAEPWALYKWQSWYLVRCFQKTALFGEFTWENVERPGWRGTILSGFYFASARADDFLICGNAAAQRILLKHGASPGRVLVAAQHGIDIKEFRPASAEEWQEARKAFGLPQNGFVIGFCGRLIPEKGISDLVAAAAKLVVQFPDIHLAMVGDGPLKNELVQKQASWLHVLAGQPSSAIARFMQSLDVFVLPSRPRFEPGCYWEEQFGHVLIEAMACGIATLGSSSGAIPEVIGFREAIFEHSNADALLRLLVKAHSEPAWREDLAAQQRERVTQVYEHGAVSRMYADFFARIRTEK